MLGAAAVALVAVAAVRGGGSATPSYARDVAPILRDTCAGCHQTGGIAPFSLETAAQARRLAPAIAAAVQARVMPPWPPGPASPRFRGQEQRTLTAAQRETLVRWARAGGRVDGPGLGKPPGGGSLAAAGEREVTLRPAAAYLPRPERGASDDYRCFLLDPGLAADAFVTSARILPDQGDQVHHVIVYRVPQARLAEARQLDAASPGEGWTCFGGTGIAGSSVDEVLNDAGWVAAWVPGTTPQRLADGLGVPLPAGSGIVMQVHYNVHNGRRPDRSAVVLTLAPGVEPLQPVRTMVLPAPVELPCGRGASDRLCTRAGAIADLRRRVGERSAFVADALHVLCGGDPAAIRPSTTTRCDRVLARPATIRVVGGHMHLLGRSIRIEANPGTPRARVVLDIPRWDFHWQGAFHLVQPIRLAAGDILRVTCRFDPSLRGRDGAPRAERYVTWGEGTADEMCLGVIQVTD